MDRANEKETKHVFRFETDFGSVTAVALLIDPAECWWGVGFAFCSPDDRGKSRKDRRAAGYGIADRRARGLAHEVARELMQDRRKLSLLTYLVRTDTVADVQNRREQLFVKIVGYLRLAMVHRWLPAGVGPYCGNADRSSFRKWFFDAKFVEQFVARYGVL